MDEALTNEELTEAVKILRLRLEAMEERFTQHGHHETGTGAVGTPIMWTPLAKAYLVTTSEPSGTTTPTGQRS